MEGFHLSSLLELSIQSLVREGGGAAQCENIACLPSNLKDGMRDILLKRRNLSVRELECLLHPGVLNLDLSGQVITAGHLEILVGCGHLRKLDLNQNFRMARKFTTGLMEQEEEEDLSSQLSQLLPRLTMLTSLHLGDVRSVTADVMSVLAQWCPLLRHLDLAGCLAVGDEAVLQLRPCERLESLSLARTPVSDRGLFNLARCESRDCLAELRINSCTAITDQGIQALLEALAGLQILIFHGCPGVTDRAREALEDYHTAHRRTVRQVTWTVY